MNTEKKAEFKRVSTYMRTMYHDKIRDLAYLKRTTRKDMLDEIIAFYLVRKFKQEKTITDSQDCSDLLPEE